jgi:HPt (histidine-containing phosphotransfer) domain-containing protein
MEPPVNFDNLHNITDNDAAVEAVVFAAFLAEAQVCLDKMREAVASGDESSWRLHAHAFKGGCLNLGAGPLSRLCDQAQMDWRASEEEKFAVLQSINDEFARVRHAVDQEPSRTGL